MGRKTISVSVDADSHDQAKLITNISQICDNAIKRVAYPTKAQLPEEQLFVRCGLCSDIVEEGYYCEERKLFVCFKCHEDWNCQGLTDHEHIRLPAYSKDKQEFVSIPHRDRLLHSLAVRHEKIENTS